MRTDDAEPPDRLRRAGWTLGVTAFHATGGGLAWAVSGRNGENLMRAEGATQGEAWGAAECEARALGMPARREGNGSGG